MGTSTRRNRFPLWLLLIGAAFLTASCSPDAYDDAERGEAAQQADVDRQLNLALADLDNEPELRDTGTPEVRQPNAPPQPTGRVAVSAPEPEPEPQPEPEPEPQPAPESPAEPQPEPEPSASEFAEAPDPVAEPIPGTVALAETEATEPAAEERWSLPANTPFGVRLEQQLNTEWSKPGDVFMARVSEPIYDPDGREIIPADAEIMGRVVSVRDPDRSGKNGSIEIAFTRVFIDGESYPLDAMAITATRLETVEAKSTGPSVGSRAAQGGLLGAVLGGLFGGRRGALIGAGAGAAASATSGGGGGGGGIRAVLAAGSQLSCVFNAPFAGPPYLRGLTL